MVFNIQLVEWDDNHQTLAAVVNKAGDKGRQFSLIPASYRCRRCGKHRQRKQGLRHRY